LMGKDLRAYTAGDVREIVAMVPQRPYLFSTTIRENLLLARPGATTGELDAAIDRAGLGRLVSSLPSGLDSWVGEQGVRLSGGERQRLALARALLRDARLLILDEPASNLDAVSEREVMEAVLRSTAGRAVLLITHRLAALEAVDEILVMSGGRIVERGRHADLLRSGPVYRRMWELQSLPLPS
ncbi:MAG TPA: ABC transporter ATP-binding protein, partial [Chloroflexota bacterium]